jgi:hypothetical protein
LLIIGSFQQSIELEQALAVLEKNGVESSQMMVIPMDSEPDTQLGSAPPASTMIEVGMAFATACGVIGTSIGFRLYLGPILWGLFSVVAGFFLGVGLHRLITGRSPATERKKLPEMTVIIQCTKENSNLVHNVMWQYKAVRVGSVHQQE